MEKSILSYEEYIAIKRLNESSDDINEGFLDAILRFFKGIFDLFNNKKLKDDAEEMSTTFREIQENEDISDDEIPDHIDTEETRKTFTRCNVYIVEKIDVDREVWKKQIRSEERRVGKECC